MPSAVRVRTSSGWQDIALQGPPGPTGPIGPTGPAGAGVPTPVVNGQWIKGVGGAAVWAAIDGSDINNSSILGRKLDWDRLTTPPALPSDGDLWVYPFTGGYWLFVYDSTEATYKWKFVGGPPLRANVATDETVTLGATYINAATVVAATLPRAGDYFFEHQCNLYSASQTAAAQVAAKVTISNGSLENNDSGIGSAYMAGGVAVSCRGQGVNTSAIAGATLTQQYNIPTAAGGTGHTRWRTIAVWPIRVS